MQSIITNRNIQLAFVGVVLFILFLGNYQFSLWDNSESSVALMAQQVIQTNNWIPVFYSFSDGIAFHPLQIWETVLSYKIFGVNEFATRFPALMYVILTLVTLFYFTRTWYNEKVAILAVVILSSSFLFPTLAKVNLVESGLLFYATVMFGTFWSSLKAKDVKMTVAFWVAALLSTFHGGFVAIVPFVGAWFVLFFMKKDWRQALMNIQPYLIIVAVIPVITWAIMSTESAENSNIPSSSLIYRHFLDTSTSVNIGRQTFLLLIGFLPWIALLPSSLIRLVKDVIKQDDTALFFGSWIGFGYILFEFLPTAMQMPSVVIYPAIAILMAQKFWNHEAACERFQNAPINEHIEIRARKAKFQEEDVMKTAQLLGVITVFVITFILSMIGYSQGVGIMRTGFVGMILWITSFIVAIGLYARNMNLFFYGAVSGSLLFVLFTWLLVIPVLEPARSFTKRTVEVIEKMEHKGKVIIATHDEYNLSSLPFYLNRKNIDASFLHKESIKSRYLNDEKEVFILDDYEYKALKEIANSEEHKATKIIPIEGILMKDRKAGNYWIVQE
ncbi:MAG: ArnT family glycosyltransferase [Saprospiraceae bacterium]